MPENVKTTQSATHSGWSWMPTSKELLQHAEDNMLKGNVKLILNKRRKVCFLVSYNFILIDA